MNLNIKSYNHFSGQKVNRIEAIADCVFSIAMTLLVLDIRTPISQTIHSEKELWMSFGVLTPKLLTYFLSFMTLGIFWTGHTVQYNFIVKSDRHLNWISLFFLMFVSIVPFSTAFLSEHIHYKFSIGVYWFNLFALGVLVLIHWNYALKHGYLNIEGAPLAEVNKAIRKRIFVAQALYFFGALLCFISTYISITFIILVQLNYALAIFHKQEKE
jgi:uncharacterized membrane protein